MMKKYLSLSQNISKYLLFTVEIQNVTLYPAA